MGGISVENGMQTKALLGLMIPFLGTVFGSACVLFMRDRLNPLVQRALTGFAAGVMVAASIWSLLVPAMEQAAHMGQWAFLPAVIGFWLGILFLLLLDRTIPHLHMNSSKAEGPQSSLQKTTMLVLAVTLHNLPEGMAVGFTPAGCPGRPGLRLWGRWRFPWGLRYRIFRKARSSPCPCGRKESAQERHFATARFPVQWNRLAPP